MLETVRMAAVIFVLPAVLWAQAGLRPNFLVRGVIERHNGEVTVTANDALPLYQVLAALQGEYGWCGNWESAPGYSHYDLADNTAPKWRSAHPNAKGITRPSGGQFTTTFLDPRDTSLFSEEAILQKVIDDYSQTDNPGRYMLRVDPENPLAIVGTAVRDNAGRIQAVTPILDTRLTLPRATRSVQDTVDFILRILSVSSGVNVSNWTPGTNFSHTPVTLGGTPAPARDLLNQALAATGRPLEYILSYDADMTEYHLSSFPLTTVPKLYSTRSGSLGSGFGLTVGWPARS